MANQWSLLIPKLGSSDRNEDPEAGMSRPQSASRLTYPGPAVGTQTTLY
jgi:hypothetical protein